MAREPSYQTVPVAFPPEVARGVRGQGQHTSNDSRANGDSGGASGDDTRASGDSGGASGDASRASGDSSGASGDASRTSGDSGGASGDASRTSGDDDATCCKETRRNAVRWVRAVPLPG